MIMKGRVTLKLGDQVSAVVKPHTLSDETLRIRDFVHSMQTRYPRLERHMLSKSNTCDSPFLASFPAATIANLRHPCYVVAAG